MHAVVVSELQRADVEIPVFRVLVGERAHHAAEGAYEALAAAVSLRVLSRAHVQLGADDLPELLPELCDEAGVPVRDDSMRESPMTDDEIENHSGCL